jgi:SAM-dependent methyltransferase
VLLSGFGQGLPDFCYDGAMAKPDGAPDAIPDAIAAQYDRWVYPEPVADLVAHSRDKRQLTDPSLSHRLYWPDRDYPAGLKILVAGCGANQAAEIAFHNPSATVVGIDVSAASLAHERTLQQKHGLDNLALLLLRVEDAATLGREFDLVISTGVLHHLADPRAGLRALRGCLAPDGVIALMLYARYGRGGIDMLRGFFAMLGLRQDAASLALVRACLSALPPNHPAAHFLRINSRDLGFDAGLVDLFLNARERAYTVTECLDLLAASDLAFQGWFTNRAYHPEAHLPGAGAPLHAAIAKLERRDMWAAIELISTIETGRHTFFACRPDRDPACYAIDFSARRFLGYVPVLASGTTATPADAATGTRAVVQRLGAALTLDDNQVVLLRRVDGTRSIRQILDAVTPAPHGRNGARPGARQAAPPVAREAEQLARDFFRLLWTLDIVQIRLPRG